MNKKPRSNYSVEENVAILKRHLVGKGDKDEARSACPGLCILFLIEGLISDI